MLVGPVASDDYLILKRMGRRQTPPPHGLFWGVLWFPDLAQAAEQEGHDLGAGAVVVGAEGGSTGAASDAVFSGPQNCGVVVGVSRHISEGIHAVRDGRLLRAPQEGDDLRAGAGCVGAEHGVAGALGDALLHGPQNRVIVVAASLHVGKGHVTVLSPSVRIAVRNSLPPTDISRSPPPKRT